MLCVVIACFVSVTRTNETIFYILFYSTCTTTVERHEQKQMKGDKCLLLFIFFVPWYCNKLHVERMPNVYFCCLVLWIEFEMKYIPSSTTFFTHHTHVNDKHNSTTTRLQATIQKSATLLFIFFQMSSKFQFLTIYKI